MCFVGTDNKDKFKERQLASLLLLLRHCLTEYDLTPSSVSLMGVALSEAMTSADGGWIPELTEIVGDVPIATFLHTTPLFHLHPPGRTSSMGARYLQLSGELFRLLQHAGEAQHGIQNFDAKQQYNHLLQQPGIQNMNYVRDVWDAAEGALTIQPKTDPEQST